MSLIFNTPEFRLVHEHYGTNTAQRSGVPLMNHIVEGIAIMEHIGATEDAVRAFCLHPLMQADEDLKAFLARWRGRPPVSPTVLVLTMEYRNQANAWLSDKVEDHSIYSYSDEVPRLVAEQYRLVGKPSPGPLPEVRHMLIADKVQNYKDFVTYHKGTHPRSRELDVYFRAWLDALGVSMDRYEELRTIAEGATGARTWAPQ